MIKVKARGNESIDQMLKRFKKMCEKEGLTKDIKRNSYYEKPSERRRRRQRKTVNARFHRSIVFWQPFDTSKKRLKTKVIS
jgi:small subunit ribosomal protein S21